MGGLPISELQTPSTRPRTVSVEIVQTASFSPDTRERVTCGPTPSSGERFLSNIRLCHPMGTCRTAQDLGPEGRTLGSMRPR